MQAIALPARTAAVLLSSIAAITLAAAMDWRIVSLAAATLAALTLIYTGTSENRRLAATTTGLAAGANAGRINAQLIGTVYGWGGLAMLAVYMLSGLAWRHGWQYGLGMLLIALGLHLFARSLVSPSSRFATPGALGLAAVLALAHGIAAALALVVLVVSGKLATLKQDWAANHIFVAGGIAAVTLSMLAFATYRRLPR